MTHNEQTLRPVSEVVEESCHPDVGYIDMAEAALTTDRDAVYTMLREAVSKMKLGGHHEEDKRIYSGGYDTAIDDILLLLDTIYGKTHTV